MPAGFLRHWVKLIEIIFTGDIAETRFVGKLVIIHTVS